MSDDTGDLFDSYEDDPDDLDPSVLSDEDEAYSIPTSNYEIPDPTYGLHLKEPGKYDHRVKVEPDSRLQQSTKVHYVDLQALTKEHEGPSQGALLLHLEVMDEVAPVWLPKKLCSNLDLEEQTVYIWNVIWDKKWKELVKLVEGY